MEQWFFRDPERCRRERSELDALKRSAQWLKVAEWNIEADGLCIDAIIHAHGHDYEVRLSYPALFPEVPLIVRPRNAQQRLSGHQYGGADGPLCLEFGPDNWHSEVTCVQMLESTYKLLEIENPLGEGRPAIAITAPSRHHVTIGQELRGASTRWYRSAGFHEFLAAKPVGVWGSFKFSLRNPRETWLVLVHEATILNGEVWKDEQIPGEIPEAMTNDRWDGAWFHGGDQAKATIEKAETLDALRAIAREAGYPSELLATDSTSHIAGFDRGIRGVVVIDQDGSAHLFVAFSSGGVIRFAPVESEPSGVESRLDNNRNLRGKSVGIVGLGSAGSKIALTLGRMGARKFHLVDHDIFLPENIVRNALDWQAVGAHKVDGTTSALRQIAADLEVSVSRSNLTGQESNAFISAVLDRLGECDLMIDATANAKVFNLLAAAAKAAEKPLVWLEIFEGGIGGLIARSRPTLDPSPQIMRAAYLRYCEENPAPHHRLVRDYSVEDSEGVVLTASDSDVSIIAHQAARLAADTLLTADRSEYPFSMYLVGLTRAWVFEAPFATIPIDTAPFRENAAEKLDAKTFGADNLGFIAGLLDKHKNATPPAT